MIKILFGSTWLAFSLQLAFSLHFYRCPNRLASETDVSEGRFFLLYSAPEAILGREVWKQLLVQRPFCDSVVTVAVDEAHCVFKW